MIIVRLSGGMGNQMFQYAAGRALALKHGVPLGLDTAFLLNRTPRHNFTFRDYDLDVFSIEANIVSRKQIPWPYRISGVGFFTRYANFIRRKILRLSGTEKHFIFDPSILALGPNAYLDGYWQSPKYFEQIADTIRKDFTLREPLTEENAALRDAIASSESVCVHVRRGDFVDSALHDVFDREYYDAALSKIFSMKKITKVYVFSDDISWCEKNLQFEYPTIYVSHAYAGKKGEGHLALMSACKHFVIANSSFSWWAAWLGRHPEKIVIAPKRWFINSAIDTSDLIPETWIRL